MVLAGKKQQLKQKDIELEIRALVQKTEKNPAE